MRHEMPASSRACAAAAAALGRRARERGLPRRPRAPSRRGERCGTPRAAGIHHSRLRPRRTSRALEELLNGCLAAKGHVPLMC